MTDAPNQSDLAALAAVIRDNIHPGEEGPLTDLWLDCAGAVLAMRQPADTLASGAGADLLEGGNSAVHSEAVCSREDSAGLDNLGEQAQGTERRSEDLGRGDSAVFGPASRLVA